MGIASIERIVRMLLGLAVLSIIPRCSLAGDVQAKRLPREVERILWCLPEDTETLLVARSFTFDQPDPNMDQKGREGEEGLNLATLDNDIGKHWKTLQGRKIAYFVQGAKNFDGVSSFGSLRSESCAVIVFEKDFGDSAKKLTDGLRKQAKAVRTLLDHEVFAFPSTTVMEPWIKQRTWQGTYYVLIEPKTLLWASSDRYLESVLRLRKAAPKARALPDHLPEWKQVDLDAPMWMLRHVPKAGAKTKIVGMAAAFRKNRFRVVYIPKNGSAVDARRIKDRWIPRALSDNNVFDTTKLKIEGQPDGSVVVAADLSNDPATDFWFGLQVHWLQAFELFDANP